MSRFLQRIILLANCFDQTQSKCVLQIWWSRILDTLGGNVMAFKYLSKEVLTGFDKYKVYMQYFITN